MKTYQGTWPDDKLMHLPIILINHHQYFNCQAFIGNKEHERTETVTGEGIRASKMGMGM